MTGDDASYEALFERYGVLRARTVDELMTDSSAQHYTYTLSRPDMTYYRTKVAVEEVDAITSKIVLSITFETADGVDIREATTNFLKFLGGNLKAMKRAAAA